MFTCRKEKGAKLSVVIKIFCIYKTRWKLTLGARDFSSAVSGFCQVFIVTRAKIKPLFFFTKFCDILSFHYPGYQRFFSRRRRSWLRPSANTETSRCKREKPLVPRVAEAKNVTMVWLQGRQNFHTWRGSIIEKTPLILFNFQLNQHKLKSCCMEGKFHHVTYNDRKRNYTVISL